MSPDFWAYSYSLYLRVESANKFLVEKVGYCGIICHNFEFYKAKVWD